PVDVDFAPIREPERGDEPAARDRVQLAPRTTVRRRACPRFEFGDELVDGTGLLALLVVPRIEHLEEDPLRPAVVLDVSGGETPARAVVEPAAAQPAPAVGVVLLDGD